LLGSSAAAYYISAIKITTTGCTAAVHARLACEAGRWSR
jgi:hypothetical protein